MIVLPVSAASDLFASRLTAFDVVHSRDGRGKSTPAQEADRRIAGTLQPFGDAKGRWLPEGISPDAAMVLHTSAAVSVAQTVHGGEVERQTYLRHGGNVWKVWEPQNWAPHAGRTKRFVCTKYVDPDGFVI